MDAKELNLDLETVEQVADMLWLSSYIVKSKVEVQPNTPKPKEDISEDKESPKKIKKPRKKTKEALVKEEKEEALVYDNDTSTRETDIKADPIRMPKKLSLSHYRAWEKSFRSFYYKVDSTREFVLDEAKTVDLIAKTKLVQPIFKAKKIKYFRLVMVIEQSSSMDIWSELLLEFQQTIQRFGVFESIAFYYLATNKEGVHLYADRALKRELDHKKLNLNRQTLLTVVSDCVSSAWHSNHIFKMLEFWSKVVPISITQMFPKRMWQGTSLYKGFQTSFTSHTFKQLNKHLVSDDDYYDKEEITFNIPVISFEPQSVEAWSSVIHGKRNRWIDGVILEKLEEEPFVDMSGNKQNLSVEERVNRFLSQASPLAQELARYASVLPINFHVIRVLQELKLPKSNQIHLAEFFLGGLIKREVNEEKKVSFDFHEGVRDYFRGQLTATASYRLQEMMSSFVSQNLNSSLDFQALIDNPNSASGLYLSKNEVAFVKLRADTLRKLGGDYGRRAKELMQSMVKGISIHIGVDFVDTDFYNGVSGRGGSEGLEDALVMEKIALSKNFESQHFLNEEATRESIVNAIALASKKLSLGDYLLLSFSGHPIPINEDSNPSGAWALYDGMLLAEELNQQLALFDENIRILIFSESYLSFGDLDVGVTSKMLIQSDDTDLNIKSTIKLLTARESSESIHVLPSRTNSIFIEALMKVWNDGAFNGTINMFFESIKEKMKKITYENKIFQEPTLRTFGGKNKLFDNQQPFSIEGVEGKKKVVEEDRQEKNLLEDTDFEKKVKIFKKKLFNGLSSTLINLDTVQSDIALFTREKINIEDTLEKLENRIEEIQSIIVNSTNSVNKVPYLLMEESVTIEVEVELGIGISENGYLFITKGDENTDLKVRLVFEVPS